MEKQPKPISLIAEARTMHRSIVDNKNGYQAIKPCYTQEGEPACPNLDQTGQRLCRLEQDIEHGRRGLECPLQHGVLTLIYKNS